MRAENDGRNKHHIPMTLGVFIAWGDVLSYNQIHANLRVYLARGTG